MKKQLICITVLLILSIQPGLYGQSVKSTELGLNLPPLLGNSLAVDVNTSYQRLFSYSYGICGMVNNRLPGKLTKEGEATYNHENSGVSINGGLRFNPGKEAGKSYYFLGLNVLGGYFKKPTFKEYVS